MIKMILCGACGRMGKAVSDIVIENDNWREKVTIVAGIDIAPKQAAYPVYRSIDEFDGSADVIADVIVDFSNPAGLGEMIKYATEHYIPAVIATTGLSSLDTAMLKEASLNIPVFTSGNMSLGINLLQVLVKKSAEALGLDFDIEVVEKHHNQKLDAPSGTALMLADAASSVMKSPPAYVFDRHVTRSKRSKKEIGIHSVRGGTIVGEHSVIFAGQDEVIEISHSALSRNIFATGALKAAVFLTDAKKGMYSMSDVIGVM